MKKHSVASPPALLQTLTGYVAFLPDAFTTVEKVRTWSVGVERSQGWHPSKAHRWQQPLILWFLNKVFHTEPLWSGLLWICVVFLCPLLLRVQLSLMDLHLPQCLPFLLFVSILSLLSHPVPYKNHPHHPMTQSHALLKKQGDSWIGDNQASRTSRTKTHYSLFCPPEDSAVRHFSVFPPSSRCWY